MAVDMWSSLSTAEAAAHITRVDGGAVSPWTGTLGAPVTLLYGFLGYGDMAFTPEQVDTTNEAVALWGDLANINFVYVNGGSPDIDPYIGGGWAQINFVNYADANSASAGHSTNTQSYGAVSVGFNMGTEWLHNRLGEGGEDRKVIVHEIGHALGLEHPGNYNAGTIDGPKPDYFDDRGYYQDSLQYTVMSYFNETNTGAYWTDEQPRTPMMDDIAAIQLLYGANTHTRTGDTIYGFHSNADRAAYHIDSPTEGAVFTIWDAGGTDTLDFSGYQSDTQVIRLTNGSFSDVGGLTANIAIAQLWTDPLTGVQYGWIENAQGGQANDYIYGNEIGNVISGNDGNDFIWGGGGNDILIGGKDTYDGDNDSDSLYGEGGYDILRGGPGDDTLDGGTDGIADVLEGGTGDDTYVVEEYENIIENPDSGYDTIVTGQSFIVLPENVETFRFTGNEDVPLYGIGSGTANVMQGGAGGDVFWGLDGNDTLDGGGGADEMYGGRGDDTYYVDTLLDRVVEEPNSQTIFADGLPWMTMPWGGTDVVHVDTNAMVFGSGFTSYTLPEYVENVWLDGISAFNLFGNDLGNEIHGNDAANIMFGFGGEDRIYAGGGGDTLLGGPGDDTLDGGPGDDILIADQDGDTLYGGEDNDVLHVISGNVTAHGDSGVDTLSFVGSTQDLRIALATRGATYTTVGSDGGVSAYTVRWDGIENLTTGDGDDVIAGDAGNNVLDAGGGDDIILVDAGYDTIFGGQGNDTLSFIGSTYALTVNLANYWAEYIGGGTYPDGSGGWVQPYAVYWSGIENLTTGAGDDELTGDSGDNRLDGSDGTDTVALHGVRSDYEVGWLDDGSIQLSDSVTGRDGTDILTNIEWLRFADGTIEVDALHSTLPTGLTLIGTPGSDTLTGGTGNDRLEGGDGLDFLTGGPGADQLLGGAGTDFLYVDADDTIVDGGAGFDYVYLDSSKPYGASFKVAGTNVEYVGGTLADDVIDATGVTYNTMLFGNYGKDTLIGGSGNDRLWGSAGNDILNGGAGGDTFLFYAGDGADRIIAFNRAEGDIIDLSHYAAVNSLADLAIRSDGAGSTLLTHGTDSILLQGVAASQVNSDWFHF